MVLALLLVAAPGMAASVAFEYRPVTDGAAPFRTVERTSLLTGRMEFSARVLDPEHAEVRGLDVLAEGVLLDGRPAKLCSSTDSAACIADFGPEIRGHRLTMVARVRMRGGSSDETTLQHRVTTLLASTRAARASPGGASLVESTGVESYPQDQVTRAVLVRAGRKPLLGLTQRDFEAAAQGIGRVRVLTTRPPRADSACLVPLLLDASTYVRRSANGASWNDGHAALVDRIVEGFRAAAMHGFDCEALVADYTTTARPLFGPFRLHTGGSLTAEHAASNERTLAELHRHLSATPPADWGLPRTIVKSVIWSDFSSVYHTLNDLLRGYPARTRILLVGGGVDMRVRPTFQGELWPARVKELNGPWPAERLSSLFDELDGGTTALEASVAEFMQGVDPNDPQREAKTAEFVAQLDPGGLSTLQAHRRDVWPPVDMLRAEGTSAPEGLTLPSLGGTFWELAPRESMDGATGDMESEATIGGALLAVADRARQSYLIDLEIPNPAQDGRSHALAIRLRNRSADRYAIEYLSGYVSSLPRARKLPVYASNRFKVLRILAAYEFREYPFDDGVQQLLTERLTGEGDPQVRAVLFESRIAVLLQHLQAGAGDVPSDKRRDKLVQTAYRELTALDPTQLPNPSLAAEAQAAAFRYRDVVRTP